MWQRKRLEVLNKYDFQCRLCYDRESTLVVHHKYYLPKLKAWEYPNDCYICLCEDCHTKIHAAIKNEDIMNQTLIKFLIKRGVNETDSLIFLSTILWFIEYKSPIEIMEFKKVIESQYIEKHQI